METTIFTSSIKLFHEIAAKYLELFRILLRNLEVTVTILTDQCINYKIALQFE